MVCSKCKETGILNYANNVAFYYCRSCKEEIALEVRTNSKDDPHSIWEELVEINPEIVQFFTWPPSNNEEK